MKSEWFVFIGSLVFFDKLCIVINKYYKREGLDTWISIPNTFTIVFLQKIFIIYSSILCSESFGLFRTFIWSMITGFTLNVDFILDSVYLLG